MMLTCPQTHANLTQSKGSICFQMCREWGSEHEVGLGTPKPQALPQPRTEGSRAFSSVLTFGNNSLSAAPNPHRAHSIQVMSDQPVTGHLPSCSQGSALLRESKICFQLSKGDG